MRPLSQTALSNTVPDEPTCASSPAHGKLLGMAHTSVAPGPEYCL